MMLRLLFFIYFVFCSNLVLSEPIPVIVISAGKTIQSKSTVGSDITVIGNDQIESNQDFFIGDTIEYSVPGMSMFQSGGYGAVTGIQMRGLPGRYSTVFIDGVKMADPSTPDNRYYGVNQIPADSVEIPN